ETLPVRPDRLQVFGQVHLEAVAVGLHGESRDADLDVDPRAVLRGLLLHVERLDAQSASRAAASASTARVGRRRGLAFELDVLDLPVARLHEIVVYHVPRPRR